MSGAEETVKSVDAMSGATAPDALLASDPSFIDPSVVDPVIQTIGAPAHGFFALLHTFSDWLVHFVHGFGYVGIFIMTFLESTFAPIPAEMTMVPAGYLAYKGEMNFWLLLLVSILGTLAGSYFNYWLAQHYGRRFLLAYGKYMLFKPEKLDAMERYFKSHGEVSIFTGRLVPGLRHFISFPAGLAHMDLKKFFIYTGVGGAIWMFVLLLVGYEIGSNQQLVKAYLPLITLVTLGLVAVGVVVYIYTHRCKLRRHKAREIKADT